jgi:hypothetical protein
LIEQESSFEAVNHLVQRALWGSMWSAAKLAAQQQNNQQASSSTSDPSHVQMNLETEEEEEDVLNPVESDGQETLLLDALATERMSFVTGQLGFDMDGFFSEQCGNFASGQSENEAQLNLDEHDETSSHPRLVRSI